MKSPYDAKFKENTEKDKRLKSSPKGNHGKPKSRDEEISDLKKRLKEETEARKTAESSLLKERRMIKTLIDIMPDIIYAKDIQKRKLFSNKADLEIIGKPESEVIGKTDMEVYPSELAKEFEKDDDMVIQKGLPVINKETHNITAFGKHIWFQTTKIPIYDNEGMITGLVGIGRDVSDKKLAENKLIERERSLEKQNQEYLRLNKEYQVVNRALIESLQHIRKMNEDLKAAKEKAEISDKLKSSFLANMSHEIRTPMNAIIGFSGFLARKHLDESKRETFVQIIKSSCDQLLAIINDIIDISKIEADQITLSNTVFNLNDIFKELYFTFKEDAESKGLNFREPQLAKKDFFLVNTDKNRLRQVLINLINNAVKFTFKGEIEIGYHLQNTGYAEIYVRDTGIGIPKKHHSDVFKRFWQVDASATREFGGNGLGLAISKALVMKMGGDIFFESKKGSGSKFSFTLPLSGDMSVSIPVHLKQIMYSTLNNLHLRKILIAEDEFYNLLYIKEFFSESPVSVVHAGNGREAVDLALADKEIDLVLMDLKMPVMDGYDAVKIIKGKRPSLPVIAISAYAMSEDREKAVSAGFDNYISKPVDTDNLIKMLNFYSGLKKS